MADEPENRLYGARSHKNRKLLDNIKKAVEDASGA